jgi:acetyl-CoA synthetase
MTRGKTLISMMEETRKIDPPEELSNRATIRSVEQYQQMYEESLKNPEEFWGGWAHELHWFKTWDRVTESDFERAHVRWFVGGKLNASDNCLDRHLLTERRTKAALIWVGESGETKTYTYEDLHREVCRFSRGLKHLGVRKGDRVAIYLPMIPELPIAMLACARLGAIHSVVFSGFSPDSLCERISDCGAEILITSNIGFNMGKALPLKRQADVALRKCPGVKHVVVVKRLEEPTEMTEGRDLTWDELMTRESGEEQVAPEVMDAEDPLFILYTSGSTGKPKGVLHTTAGYLLHCKKSFEWVFDYRDQEIFWCTEDLSWIIGHSYGLYGPLTAGATLLLYEGRLNHPKPDRPWEIIDKHRVNIFYTTPAVLRSCMKERDEWVTRHDVSSLRILGSVGEPIHPHIWMWYYTIVGKERCPIVDTWWQTETGAILIAPFPGATPLKPGSATLPFFGVEPAILREDGTECEVNEGGYLVIKRSWPGMMRTVYGHPGRFQEIYLSQFPGMYFTGDGARRDEDGYYWFLGRVDDVIHSSGVRLGTAEIESALVSHAAVAEAAVVPFPHPLKGQGIYAFVTLRSGFEKSEETERALKAHVEKKIGPIATPDKIQWVDVVSKTLSGKIARRILRKVAAGDVEDLGDTSALADLSVIKDLIRGRQETLF